MDPETEEIIKKQMLILPIEVRKLFADPGLNDKILNIGKKNGLNEEQLGILQLETNLVLLGLVYPDEYSDELRNRLKTNEMKVDNILNDINNDILNGIREKLIETFNKDDDSQKNKELEIEPVWVQNLDFIFSGGNYSSFMEKNDIATPPPSSNDNKKINTLIEPQKMTDLNDKLVL